MVASVDAVIHFASGQRDVGGDASADQWIGVRGGSALVRKAKHATVAYVNRELHGIGAGLQVGERVVAEGIGDGGANRETGAIQQGNGYALDAGFIGVLDAIAVEVFPHEVTDGGERRSVASVEGHVRLASGESDVDGLACGEVGVAIGSIRALILGGKDNATRQAGGELHGVRARLQTGEEVVAGGIGKRGADGCAGAVEQGDGYALDAGFAGILLAVLVEIHPNIITQAGERRRVTSVDGAVVFSGGEGDIDGLARGSVGIAIGRRCTLKSGGQCEAVAVERGGELDGISAGLEIRELIEAAGVRGRGADGGACAVEQDNWHSLDPWFAGVLLAVLVHIQPNVIADGCQWRHIACIEVRIVLACGKHDRWRAACGLIGIAVGVVRGVVRNRQHMAGAQGCWEADAVRAGLQVAEVIVADAVGGGGADQGAKVVVEIDSHSLDAGFASVLETIAVKVEPDIVANGSQRGNITCVDGAIVLTSGENDSGGLAGSDHWVAVRSSRALLRSGEHCAVGQRNRELHIIGAWVKIDELIPALAIRGGGADGGAAAVEQGDGHALDAGFVGILLEVAVQVHPHVVANRSLGRDVACVDGDVGLACGKRYGSGHACRGDRIAVRASSAGEGGGQHVAVSKGGGEFHGVGASLQIPEHVVSQSVRGCRTDGGAAAVVEDDGYVLDTGFAGILLAVLVQVEPDVIAQGSERRVVASVDGAVVFSGGEGDVGCLPGCCVGIAVSGRCARKRRSERKAATIQ